MEPSHDLAIPQVRGLLGVSLGCGNIIDVFPCQNVPSPWLVRLLPGILKALLRLLAVRSGLSFHIQQQDTPVIN